MYSVYTLSQFVIFHSGLHFYTCGYMNINAEIFTMSYTHGFQMSGDTSVCPLESSPNAWDSSPLWLSCVYALRKIFYIHIVIVHNNKRRKRLTYIS